MSGGQHKGVSARALVVDHDPVAGESIAEFLREEGMATETALCAAEAFDRLGEEGDRAWVVVAEAALPDADDVEFIAGVRERRPDAAVILTSSRASIEGAVRCVRAGASDYLTKPIIDEELRLAMRRALREQTLRAENTELRRRLDSRFGMEQIVGQNLRMHLVFDLVESVAPSNTTVLMTGESGTGKSMIARAIHAKSPRRARPFIEIACGSIPETLLESELFGHVKGAFTGAHADKPGRFLAADGGTIFLDEINSAPPSMQLKLLRVLQERAFEPVGSAETIEVDVRVILASNQPLEQLVADGSFRADLYYRINVINIELPPLRERVSDIPLLADHFLAKHAATLGKQIVGFSDDALERIVSYAFPGNVRELSNVIERAAVLTKTPTIGIEVLPPELLASQTGATPAPLAISTPDSGDDAPWRPMPLEEALREPERRVILRALRANGWNRQKTADDLEINRTTLYKKMKQLGIDPDRERLAG